MKTKLLVGMLSGLWLAACAPEVAPNEDVNALHERFHGKYKPISSVASEPIDVNLDGKLSVDLFREYNYLDEHDLRIDIYGPNKHRPTNVFSFYQMWPEQYVRTGPSKEWNGEVLTYDASAYVNFAGQGSIRRFSLATDLTQLYVLPNEKENSFRWQRPESVTVQGDGLLRVVNKRRLFTTAGVKDVVITTLYERYTMST